MSDLISRKALCEYALNQKDKSITPNDIMRLPSAQPDLQPTCNQLATDCISRQDAIDLVRNCNVKEVTPAYMLIDKAEIMTELMMLPPAQPEERTEEHTETHSCDCIYRQSAIDMIMGQPPEAHYPSWYAEQIKALPSAEPESETGIWIWKHYVWWCSECGKNPTKGMGYVPRAEELFDYCPHCGKKMEGVQM